MKMLRKSLGLLVLAALMVLAAKGAAWAEDGDGCKGHHHYTNERFNFHIVYPDGLQAQPEPANGDGRRFVDKKLGFILTASGCYDILGKSALGYAKMAVPEGVKWTKQEYIANDDKNDVAISWKNKGKVCWLRSAVYKPMKGDDGMKRSVTVLIEYPEKNSAKCRPLVDGILFPLTDTAE